MSAAREYQDRANPPVPEGEAPALYVYRPATDRPSTDAALDTLAEVLADLLPDAPTDDPQPRAA